MSYLRNITWAAGLLASSAWLNLGCMVGTADSTEEADEQPASADTNEESVKAAVNEEDSQATKAEDAMQNPGARIYPRKGGLAGSRSLPHYATRISSRKTAGSLDRWRGSWEVSPV